MPKINNGMVQTYIADLIPPLVSEISGYPIRNNNNLTTPFTRTNFQQDHVYHQLSECGTTLMKVLKPNHQYHLSSIVYKPLFFKQYKYLANTHLEKDIRLYCMLE